MWAKNSGKISLLTDYRIFWKPQIRYKRSPIYHWVSKLSQKWLLKVKNGMKSDNNRSHVNKSLHLGLCSLGIFYSHITDSNFQVAGSNQWSFYTCQTQSKNTIDFDRKLLYSCQIIMGISWFIGNTVSKILCTAGFSASSWEVSGTGSLTYIRWEQSMCCIGNSSNMAD